LPAPAGGDRVAEEDELRLAFLRDADEALMRGDKACVWFAIGSQFLRGHIRRLRRQFHGWNGRFGGGARRLRLNGGGGEKKDGERGWNGFHACRF
jgi:hypothetical protein